MSTPTRSPFLGSQASPGVLRFLEGSAALQLEALRRAVREREPAVMMTADPRVDATLVDPEAAIAEALTGTPESALSKEGDRRTRLVGPAAGGWVVDTEGRAGIGLLSAIGAEFRGLVMAVGAGGAVGAVRRGIDLGLAWDVTPAEALAWLAEDPDVMAIGLAGVPGARHAGWEFAATLCEVAARVPVMALGAASEADAWAVFGVQTIEDADGFGRALRDAAEIARASAKRPREVVEEAVEALETGALPGLERAQTLLAAALLMRRTALGRHATLEVLEALGAGKRAPALVVASLTMARDAAARLGYPVVLGSDAGPLGAEWVTGPEGLAAAWDVLGSALAEVGAEAAYEPRYVAAVPAGAHAVEVQLGASAVGPVVTIDGRARPACERVPSSPIARALAALAEDLPEVTNLDLRAAETPGGLVLVDARARLERALEVPRRHA